MLSDLHRTLHAAREDQDLLEEGRRLTDRVADALVADGFARHFVPERWDGCAGTFTALLDAVSSVAETCASTAWCAALYAAHGRLASYLPEEGQRALWGRTPDVCVAASVVPPQGRAERVDGGWRLTGEWTMASGVDQADWVLLASLAEGPAGAAGPARENRVFAVPRPDVKVRDTWHPIGMRGTGSNTVEAEVFVPEHLSFTVSDLARAQPHAARCHTVPFPLVAGLIFAAPVLGAAEGILRHWWNQQCLRTRPDGGTAAQQPFQQRVLARASAHIQSARLLLERAAQRADTAPITPLLVAENQRDVAAAVELCGTAADEMLHAAGARALDDTNPLQRAWRDITAARAHGTLDPEKAAAAYARARLAAQPADLEGAR
ncbi:acyl-CoA dehydrogenase family protein [Streptomyces sp. NPDC046939]|uniref:acyl-CoA dehydrogenase family protein n=1 Tax=Streptomyces sp. NPDC046939 TaxID=3155376 RepID=UPI0033BFD897